MPDRSPALLGEMMVKRRRMIDPSIWEDEHFGRLSDKAKILFISCFSNADDEGRLSGNLSNLRSNAFRFEKVEISLKKIEDLLGEIANNLKHFKVYIVNNCRYIWFESWNEYQTLRADRTKISKIPIFNNGGEMSTECQPNVNHETAQVNISKDKLREVKLIQEERFEEIYKKYPKKDGTKMALKHFIASVITDKNWTDINKAIDRYIKYLSDNNIEPKFIKNASTWFNNWTDWIDFKEVEDPNKEGWSL